MRSIRPLPRNKALDRDLRRETCLEASGWKFGWLTTLTSVEVIRPPPPTTPMPRNQLHGFKALPPGAAEEERRPNVLLAQPQGVA